MAGHRHLDKVQRGSLSLLLMSGVSAGRLKGWGDLTAGHQNPLEASSLTRLAVVLAMAGSRAPTEDLLV